jgi:hypothetical protein
LFSGELPITGKKGILYVSETGAASVWNGSTYISIGGSMVEFFTGSPPVSGESGIIYVDQDSGAIYVWDGAAMVTGSASLQEDITYAALATAIGASELVPGLKYRITDFATRHYIIDGNGVQYLSDTITGTIEPLIVTAIDVNKLDKVAISSLYPQDIIYYDWNPANWLTDKYFSSTSIIISNFKGVIYFRHDTKQDNYIGYDFRNVRNRRWKLETQQSYNAGTSYSKYDFVKSGSTIYISKKNANIGNSVSDIIYWQSVSLTEDSEYISTTPNSYYYYSNLITSSSEYLDYLTFQPLGSDTYEGAFWRNHIEIRVGKKKAFDPPYSGLLSNTVFFGNNNFNTSTHDNTISSFVFFNNTFGSNFYNNEIHGTITNTSIGKGCINNSLFVYNWSFDRNIIGSNFTSNVITNEQGIDTCVIGSGMSNNHISYISGCLIGTGFVFNNVGYIILSNIKNNFRLNDIGSGVTYFGSLDLDTATHIYGNYKKEIFNNSTGVTRLSYYNGSDVLTIANPTD